MASWNNLPLDTSIMIAEKIEFLEDFKAFGGVCTWWRRAIKIAHDPSASRRTPWLMFAEPPYTSKRRFSVNKRMVQQVELPVPSTIRGGDNIDKVDVMRLNLLFKSEDDVMSEWKYFSSRGWLICVTQIGFNVTLVHPLSGMVIQPPAVPEHSIRRYNGGLYDTTYLTMFEKFALSDNPSTTSDYMIAMIFPTNTSLAFWRNGDKEWSLPRLDEIKTVVLDITFYKGEYYALDGFGKIWALGKSSPPPTPRLVADKKFRYTYPNSTYLVESAGVLLFVLRKVYRDEKDDMYKTTYFKVWEVDVENGETKEVTSLWNRSLFLGHNSSFSMEAFPSQGCKPNSIYYTDNIESNTEENCDTGVYDLTSGQRIEDLCDDPMCISSSASPLWVESPLVLH